MTDSMLQKIISHITTGLAVRPQQAAVAMQLLGESATIPLIARYHKGMTDNLDNT